MKHKSNKTKNRLKASGIALAGLAVGIGLIIASFHFSRVGKAQAPATGPAPASQPAPASAPASGEKPARPPAREAAAQNMSGLFLMFALVSFAVSGIAIGWIVYDIRHSKPAWQTQTKYPRRR